MRKTSGNSNYDAQYKAKSLAAKVSTSTSFASITDYSPKRTIGETDVGYADLSSNDRDRRRQEQI